MSDELRRRKPPVKRKVKRRKPSRQRQDVRRSYDGYDRYDRYQDDPYKGHHNRAALIMALIAIALIIVISGVYFVPRIMEHFMYSSEEYDMLTYFENSDDEDAAVIFNCEFMTQRALVINGIGYLDLETVNSLLNNRFYYDETEGLLIYTEPLNMFVVKTDSDTVTDNMGDDPLGYTACTVRNDNVMVALPYVKRFTDLDFQIYEDPYRIKIDNDRSERMYATVKKNSAVRHRGGIKSPILEKVSEKDKLTVLEQMEDWAKVMTEDAVIGFIENKHLEDIKSMAPDIVSDYKEPEYTSLTSDQKIIMGWHAVEGAAGNDTFDSLVSQTSGMNVIAPTWFRLNDPVGGFESIGSESYVSKAHEKGLQVWIVVDNIHYKDQVDMETLLRSTTNRQTLINGLVSEVTALGADGINVDIEMLPSSVGRDFSEFIRELSIACRRDGIVLSVDNYVPIGGTGYYDRKTQGEVADYVVIMGYDEHYAGSSEAGSVASIGYVETGIEMTTDEVPASKVINGIPFYTRIWESNGSDVSSQAVDMATAADWLKAHNLTPEWDEETCQNYATYTSDNTVYQCWLEDEESIKVKLNVMESFGLGGLACWRLGFETPSIWKLINEEYINR